MYVFDYSCVLLIALVTIASCEKCEKIIPHADVFKYGYDITRFELDGCSKIGGQKQQIIQLDDCSKNIKYTPPTQNISYDQPNILEVTSFSASSYNDGEVYRTFTDYQYILRQFDVENQFKSGSSSSSESYQLAQMKYINGSLVATVVSSKGYTVDLVQIDAYFMRNETVLEFSRAIGSLPEVFEGNEQTFLEFIKSFGTHYISQGTFGGLIRRFTDFNKEFKTKNDFEMIVAAKEGFPTANENDTEICSKLEGSNQALKYRNEKNNYTQVVLGGDVNMYYAKGEKAWWHSVRLNPHLLHAKLNSLARLLKHTDKKRAALDNAIKVYVKRAHLTAVHRSLKMLIDQGFTLPETSEVVANYTKLMSDNVNDLKSIDALVKRIDTEVTQLQEKQQSQ